MLARNRAASACMDLSDGLADAATQVATASNVGMAIDAAALPIGAAAGQWFATRGEDPVAAAVAGGDDYELLFTSRPSHRGRLRHARREMGVPVTKIGVVTKHLGVTLQSPHGDRPMPDGYEHFR
jgi:thiamine-monophosphate kinase